MKKISNKICIACLLTFAVICTMKEWTSKDYVQMVSNECTSVYALEQWDYFVADSKGTFYVENQEKNLIQKFDSDGNFQKAYYMGNEILGVCFEENVLHVLTKDGKEYCLLNDEIKSLGECNEDDPKWSSYEETREAGKYSIFHNKITRKTRKGEKEIRLNTPIYPFPARWYFYGIVIFTFLCVIQWILGEKQRSIINEETDFLYLHRFCPERGLHLSLSDMLNLVIGIIGFGFCILAILCIFSSIYVLGAGLFLIGIPFFWMGIGNLCMIQYIKHRSIYYVTNQAVIIVKKYKKTFCQEIPFTDITDLKIVKQTGNTACLKIRTPYAFESTLSRKYEEYILYDLKDIDAVIEAIRKS